MDQARAEEIVDFGNRIIEMAKDLAPDFSVIAVYDILRRLIRRPDRPINPRELKGRPVHSGAYLAEWDPVFKRQLQIAQQSGDVKALDEFWLTADRLADRLAQIEEIFYMCDPVSPSRLLRILSQKRMVREGINGVLKMEGSGEPLEVLTAQHILDWAEARDAA